MRSSVASALACALALATSTTARAQGTGGTGGTGGGTGTSGLGSCSGMLGGTVGLSVPTSSGRQTVQAASVPYVFNFAECECSPTNPNNQIDLEILLKPALPIGTPGTVELWVGNGCDNYTTRTTPNQTACQKITALDINRFTTGSTEQGLIEIPIPGDALISPQPTGGQHMCSAAATTSNSIYIFAYTNPMMPFGTCTLNLTEQTQGPASVTNVGAGSGDGAINLSWMLPPQGSFSPKQFQILCSDADGNPITSSPPAPLYSTCVNGVLQRRQISTGGTTSVGTGVDAGTTTIGDGGVSRIPNGGVVHPLQALLDMAGTDMAGVDMATATGDMATNPVTFGPLAHLDERFVCSSQIAATSTTARISGLTNFKTYYFVVVGIDQYGNPTPSASVSGIPKPVEDLYRRYRDKGGAPGGCFIATAAFGSYESGWVHVLRDFRDDVLLDSSLGRDFVDWYYAHSPPWAEWLTRHPVARTLVRLVLVPVIGVAGAWVYSTAWQKAVVLLLAMAWLMRRRLVAAWRGAGA